MIHILLLILKIIGWILLGVLGILILLAGIFLLVPVRYCGDILGEGDLEKLRASVKFSWLCSLVKGEFLYQDGKFKWKLRLAWKNFSEDQQEQAAPSVPQIEERTNPTKKTPKQKAAKHTLSDEVRSPKARITGYSNEDTVSEPQKAPESKPEFGERIQKKIEQIKCTFYKIYDRLKSLIKKKEILIEFLTDEIHQAAFVKGLKEIRRLIRLLKPSKCEAELEFGFSDPSVTGYALAGASLIYPFVGENMDITPNFEEKILKGNATIKGRVHTCYFLVIVWNLLWNKNIRTTISHIRKLRF